MESILKWRRPAMAMTTLAMASMLSMSHAGMITSIPSASGALGFGGWNLDNVTVNVVDGSYDELTGSYVIGADGLYTSDVQDEFGTVMSTIIAKPWPIGEPPGVKVINDDLAGNPTKPINCIISTSYLADHYLDSVDPQQVLCSSGFQTHKRYKQAMRPSMVDGIGSEGADMVFNVETEAGFRDYQVFQKINNWTDSRLEGFTIQVGFGVGADFVSAEALGLVSQLSLAVPGDVWRDNQLATFSHGLFGTPDKHFPEPGFFDNTAAGYFIDEYPAAAGTTGTLTATRVLPGNYADVPPGGELASNQFGPWLPNIWLPQGIFFDTDGNPDTDADLVAWFGYNPAAGDFTWMTGATEGFQTIPDAVIAGWAGDLAYSMAVIDDLVNVGLNYIVTVGDVSQFPSNTFTIRITPTKDTSGTGIPGFVGVEPSPALLFTSSDALIVLSPSPEFLIGDTLTVRVGDADKNLDPAVLDTLNVQATSSTGLSETVTLTEEGEDRGVFVANLPDDFSNVVLGTQVTVTYADNTGDISASSTAQTSDTITESFVVIDSLRVPDSVKGGDTKTIRVKVENEKNATQAESGFLTVTADGVIVFEAGFLLDPNKSVKYSFDWTAPNTAQVVEWVASVVLDSGGYVAPLTDTTLVKVKRSRRH